MSGSLGLYLHIPFCVQKCAYCAFYSLPGQGAGRQRDYVRALEEQLRSFAAGELGLHAVIRTSDEAPVIGTAAAALLNARN